MRFFESTLTHMCAWANGFTKGGKIKRHTFYGNSLDFDCSAVLSIYGNNINISSGNYALSIRDKISCSSE
jgi:hypothetical protein